MDDDGRSTTYFTMTTYCRTMISTSLSSFLPVLDSWLPVVRQCRFFSDSFSKVVSRRPFPRFVRIIILSYASLYLSMLSLYSSYCIYTACICTSTRREPRVYISVVACRRKAYNLAHRVHMFINSAYLCPSSATNKACFVSQNESHITLRLKLCSTSGCAGARFKT